jgi:molecular chaperone Hsp33
MMEGYTPSDLLQNLFGAEELQILTTTEVSLYPAITRHEYARMLATLPLSELQAILAEDHGVEIVDRFTGKVINFDETQLQAIIASKDASGL